MLTADSKAYPIDLSLNGGIVMTSPDDKGQVTMPADIEGGEVRVRIDGAYLTEALRACGGMVDFKLTDGKSPVLFVVDGYQLVVMPMLTADSQKPAGEHRPPSQSRQKPRTPSQQPSKPRKPKR